MAITFLCPACGAVATVSDESRGMSGVCGHCKLRLKVPTALKFCVACHKDVATEKRIKDPNGFYYCEPCYADRLAKKGAVPGKNPVAASAGVKMRMLADEAAVDQGAAKPVEDLEAEMVSLDDLPIEGEMIGRKRKAVAAISSGHQPPAVAGQASAAEDEFALADQDEDPAIVAHRAPAAAKGAAAPVESGEFALADESRVHAKPAPMAPVPVAAPVAPVAPAAGKAKPLPAKCPNCGTPRISKSFLCVGCQRDLRQMDNLIKMQADDSEDKANRWAKIAGWSIAGVVIVAVLLVAVWVVWVRVLDMVGPAKDVWPEKATELTDNQKKEIDEDFHQLQDVQAMAQVIQDGQRLKANFGWWMGHSEESKQTLVTKLSLYAQMHAEKSDVLIVAESGITLAEKKGGKITIVQKPVEPVEPPLGP